MLCCARASGLGNAASSNEAAEDVSSASSASTALEVIYSREHQHAAAELRRYLYLISDELPTLTLLETASNQRALINSHQQRMPIILAGPRADDPLAHALLTAIDAGWPAAALGDAAGPHDHVLRASPGGSAPAAVICHGATTLGTRYAVYSLLEALGVGFRLHGQDAVPRLRASDVVEQLRGLRQQNLSPGAITTRGIQPFRARAPHPRSHPAHLCINTRQQPAERHGCFGAVQTTSARGRTNGTRTTTRRTWNSSRSSS